MRKAFTLSIILAFLAISLHAQGQSFVRSATIQPPPSFGSGFGSTVSGVDLDGDGKVEIYSINGMSDFFTGDEYPQIVKYERNGNQWDSVWAAKFPNERQNSWGALAVGDLDGDGKQEIVWGFVNSFTTNTTPPRIVVFENQGDDLLGISDGSGNFTPNAAWNFDLAPSTNFRPVRWQIGDVDSDGKQEVVLADRQNYYSVAVVSVDDVPDAGGAANWTLEFSKNSEVYNKFVRTGILKDEVVGYGDILTDVDFDGDGLMDLYAVNEMYDFLTGDEIPRIYKYELENGAWALRWSTRSSVLAQNSYPTLTATDFDNDGLMELTWTPINNFVTGNEDPARIIVFEQAADSSDVMGIDNGDGTFAPNASWNFDLAPSTNFRPFSAEVADFNNDGQQEFVFTTRAGAPKFAVATVDNIPDNGDGSETWSLAFDGTPLNIQGTYVEVLIDDQTIYLLSSNGNIYTIDYDNGNYTLVKTQSFGSIYNRYSASLYDVDNDGVKEIISGDWNTGSGGNVYLYVKDADSLVSHMIASLSDLGITRIAGGSTGDINGDGNMDIVVASFGTDKIGRISYNGGSITDAGSYSTSLLDEGILINPDNAFLHKVKIADLNNDGSDEIIYSGLDSGDGEAPIVIGSYADTLKAASGSRWDISIANNMIQVYDGSGNLQTIKYENGEYVPYPSQPAVANGTFLSASPADIDDDGVDEIMIGNWYDAKVTLLKWMNGAWASSEVYDFASVGGARLNGGAAGDIDNDGFMDFVFGSRGSTPNAQIYRVEYMGGDIMDPNNWRGEVIDQELDPKFTQYEVVNIANLDDDPELEVLYSSDYARGEAAATDPQVPIVILDVTTVQTTPIADVKVDSDNNGIPDNLDQEFTVKGVVTSVNLQANSADFGYYIQDETAGIFIFANNDDSTTAAIGDLLQITGTVSQYNGLTQLSVSNSETNIVPLGVGTVPPAVVLTVEEFLAEAEKYEGSRIRINGLVKVSGTWPEATSTSSGANITLSNGTTDVLMRIDNDTDLKNNPEPTYPISFIGIGSQFDSSDPYTSGYQVLPQRYADIFQNVAVPPSPNFALLTPADGAEIMITDSSQTFTATWEMPVDLNGDALIYQFILLPPNAFTSNPLTDTSYTFNAEFVLGLMGGADTADISWTVRTKGTEPDIVASVDTFTVTFINDIPVSVEENIIPKEFYVDQNYPNPFNPTTVIQFGLPVEQSVTLKIYDILGQEVVTLVNNEVLKAGTYKYNFNASALASGTYIYRIQTDKNVVSKKMLLVK